jgi:hypothetical protein
MGQGSIFLTTKNNKPDTKSQQEKWQKENNKTDTLQMGLHFKVSESRLSVERSNYSIQEYIVHH